MSSATDSFPTSPGISISYATANGQISRDITIGETTLRDARPVTHGTSGEDPAALWWASDMRGATPRPALDLQTIRFVDLFSSVGGLSLGAVEAIASLGMRARAQLAADIDVRALQIYRKNFRPRQVARESVRGMIDFRISGTGPTAEFAYQPAVIDDRLLALAGSVDLLLAGPPCQGHSSLNNHSRHDDPKNLLYLTVPAAAVALRARHIVIENVPNVVRDKNNVAQTTINLLQDNGYHVTYGVLAAHRLGWPQTRKRFFIVASSETRPLPLKTVEEALRREPSPVWPLIRDLADIPLGSADFMDSVPEMSAENRQRIDWLFDNDEYNLPNEIRPDCHKGGHTYPSTYGRMYPDQPAPTITSGFVTPGRGRFIHPVERRVITPREAARIQGFPDWFDFSAEAGTTPHRTELAQWIGNAVPSVLGFTATFSALAGEFKASNADVVG